MHATHTVTLLVRLNPEEIQCSSKRGREREREKENIETTKTEQLCCVQSFNWIQQMAPCYSLAVYV